MTILLKQLLTGPSLNRGSKKLLLGWLRATATGLDRIRAGTPEAWLVGDKTGTGEHGAVNDVAVLFPPEGEPVFLSVFTTGDGSSPDSHEKGIAEATKLVLEELK